MTTLITPETPIGMRDFSPKEMAKRNYVLEKMKSVFVTFGYDAIETPAIEYARTLQGKYGIEGTKLEYTFKDHDKRKLALRYDQTVPFARFVAANYRDLPMPFKRYQISPVWRAEKPVKGKYREFYQCDIDIVGTDSLLAEGEIARVIVAVFESLGFKDFVIKVNSRRFIKNEKDELATFFSICRAFDIPEKFLSFDPKLTRGWDYYTGLVFEVFVPGLDSGFLCGGGRYDDLCSSFCEKKFSGVGVAFDLDRIISALESMKMLADLSLHSQALVTFLDKTTLNETLRIANRLREDDIRAEVYFAPDKLEKQIKYAEKKGIPFVIVCGPEELSKEEALIKVMKTGKQKHVPLTQLSLYLLGYQS